MLFLVSSNSILRQRMMPTLDESDAVIDAVIANGMKTSDANDLLYAVESSYDYDPAPALEKSGSRYLRSTRRTT
jgi:homoserine O-acetyltransferase